MRRAEFEANPTPCKFCGGQPQVREHEQHPGGGVWCAECGRHQFWLSKDRAEAHRPALKRGTIQQVWDAWSNHCAHCGLNESDLEFLGIARTVQHVPPFKDAGHDAAFFIPLCDWCQQQSASWMKRLHSLINRLRESEHDV
jgi:hypothetical protein